VERLVKEGFGVTVLDNLSTGWLENLGHLDNAGMRFVKGDLRDVHAVVKALKDAEAVFHLAAISSVSYSVENPVVTYDVNVEGTRNLLEACLRNSTRRLIYVSTCAVYGEPEYLPLDEKHPTRPVSPYAETKLEAERLCREFQDVYGLECTILRLFNVYGLRMRNDHYGGVIARFIERLLDGEPPIIYGDGGQTRDFIYVSDVVGALMSALNRNGAVGRIFNIATGVPTSVNQIARVLIELFGWENVKPRYRLPRQGDIRDSYADIKEAGLYLGFEPAVTLREGLSALIGSRMLPVTRLVGA